MEQPLEVSKSPDEIAAGPEENCPILQMLRLGSSMLERLV